MPAVQMAGVEVPASWKTLSFSAMEGLVMVIGATDTGKTTLARYAFHRLSEYHPRVAFIDGDVGQATLGPPTTMTLALGETGDGTFPPAGSRYHVFVGDISPTGHMLRMLVGAHRLVAKARDEGATAVVFDTTGLVDRSQGGGALKFSLVDLLRPRVVIGLQRGTELEHLLVPLRCSQRTRVVGQEVVGPVERRDATTRRAHRTRQYRQVFRSATSLEICWDGQAVIPTLSFTRHRLVALEDEAGFVRGLGIVTGREWSRSAVTLLTSLSSPEDVDVIHVGDVAVDPETFRDERL
jgi:polynucleotide 5'-hydroxyl-kinase GRC3/NOL9